MSGLELLSAIGSVASIASFTQQWVQVFGGVQTRSRERVEPKIFATIRDPKQIVKAAKAYSAGKMRVDAAQVDLAALESPVLEVLVDRLASIEREAAEKLAGPKYTMVEMQSLVDRLKSEVCFVLRQIKSVNAGQLPGKPLVKKWIDFGCA